MENALRLLKKVSVVADVVDELSDSIKELYVFCECVGEGQL